MRELRLTRVNRVETRSEIALTSVLISLVYSVVLRQLKIIYIEVKNNYYEFRIKIKPIETSIV